MIRPQDLRFAPVFSDLDDDSLAWLASQATLKQLEPGEALFSEGDVADLMFVVLEGEVRAKREQGPPDGRLFIRKSGQLGGMLPFSRITHFPVTCRAVLPTQLACFSSEVFPSMLQRIPMLESRLASTMADRVRETTQFDQQRDKLTSLGKLAAGLAHEINNPAAAIQRSLAELHGQLEEFRELSLELLERHSALSGVRTLTSAATPHRFSSDEEEALTTWLETKGVAKPWLVSESLLTAGLDQKTLEAVTAELDETTLLNTLRWLVASCCSHTLLAEAEEAAKRISVLVAAVKSYSHMDEAPTKVEVDVHEGLEATLAVLAHKLNAKAVKVNKAFSPTLPRLMAHPGELNQVWTQLIDNAIDAVPAGGEVSISTSSTGVELMVQVADNGPGIPQDIQWRIFEPFFTTKDVGQGTGLGLDLAQRIVQSYRGDIRLESTAGRTCFMVHLPLAPG